MGMRYKISQDFKKYTGGNTSLIILLIKIFHNPGMIFSILYRIERYFLYSSLLIFRFIGYIFYPLYFLITYYILDYHIEPIVNIDSGLFLHNRGIVITDNVTIGKNFNSKEVNILIGDNVKVGTGAKIIASGTLKIADGIIIGANAVVTKSLFKKDCVYVGVPARLIKKESKKICI